MRDFHKIIVVLKEYVVSEKRVYDKDIAILLKISQSQFATLKCRNSTPYSHILEFCYKENICSNEIFFD